MKKAEDIIRDPEDVRISDSDDERDGRHTSDYYAPPQRDECTTNRHGHGERQRSTNHKPARRRSKTEKDLGHHKRPRCKLVDQLLDIYYSNGRGWGVMQQNKLRNRVTRSFRSPELIEEILVERDREYIVCETAERGDDHNRQEQQHHGGRQNRAFEPAHREWRQLDNSPRSPSGGNTPRDINTTSIQYKYDSLKWLVIPLDLLMQLLDYGSFA